MHLPQWTHWVFDGFGVAIPLALVGWFVGRRRGGSGTDRSQTIKSGKNSTNVQAQGDLTIRDIGKP